VCTKAIPVTTGRVLTRRCKHVGGVGAEVDEVVGGSKNGVGVYYPGIVGRPLTKTI
jgi:hypothetical protein